MVYEKHNISFVLTQFIIIHLKIFGAYSNEVRYITSISFTYKNHDNKSKKNDDYNNKIINTKNKLLSIHHCTVGELYHFDVTHAHCSTLLEILY